MTTTSSSELRSGTHVRGDIDLRLRVRDQDVIEFLSSHINEVERNEVATTALRIGVLAMRQAQGELDAHQLRDEGQQLLDDMRETLISHSQEMTSAMREALRRYLDPEGGFLQQRLERLVSSEGELAKLLRSHVAGSDSEIARTLAEQVGNRSELFRLLDPGRQDSLLAQLSRILEEAVRTQREQVLREFSLDNGDGALAKLLGELTDNQGQLRQDLQEDLSRVVAQFSLDDETSALSRLVARVDHAQRGIVQQFSLDDEGSALSRLRREMLDTIDGMVQRQQAFHAEVGQMMAALDARRKADARGTQHGLDFERHLGELLSAEAARQGDLFEAVGTTTGALRNCKVGDHLITVGPDHVAADLRVVFEAKQNGSVSDAEAIKELHQAKENRQADVGVFVFSRKVAGENREPLRRVGDDLIIVWDDEDPTSDVYLRAAYSVAKAILQHKTARSAHEHVDLGAMDAAIAEVERQADRLDQMKKQTGAIRSSADKLDTEIDRLRKVLEREVVRLRDGVETVRKAL